MDVIPTIRAPREDARTLSAEDSNTWRERYEAYLRSSDWRRTRDAALSRAGWKCSRCPAHLGLQVHHKTYARLGCERPEDLEVLCLTCHEGHHVDEHQEVKGIYVKVVSEVLRVETFTSVADLMEAVKSACARNQIRYDGRKVWRAISIVDANRHGVIDAPKPRVKPVTWEAIQAGEFNRPPTKAEALEFFRDHGISLASRAMPAIENPDYLRDLERANQIRREAAEILKAAQLLRRERALTPNPEHEARVREQAAAMLRGEL